MGGASRWWLHHSLQALDAALRERGSRLILRRGSSPQALAQLAREVNASAIHCLRHYEPWWRNAERALQEILPVGTSLIRHEGLYLVPPGSVKTGSGGQFKIYTPFWRALAQHMPPARPRAAPDYIPAPETWPDSDSLDSLALQPSKPDWAGARARFLGHTGRNRCCRTAQNFLPRANRYEEKRNLPSIPGTSFLSPHLHFGEIFRHDLACGNGRRRIG